MSLVSQEPLSVPLIISEKAPTLTNLPFVIQKIPGAKLLSMSALSDMNEDLTKKWYDTPPLGYGANIMGNNTILALFNGASYHTVPMAVQLITNTMLKAAPDSIRLSIEIYDVPKTEFGEDDHIPLQQSADSNLVVAIIVILAFSSLSSTFVMPLVEDNVSRFKNQLLLTKMRIQTYWMSLIIWHFILYTIFCSILTAIFLIFGWMEGCLLL